MGEVYRATDTNLKRQVAIKVLPDAVATDAERLARFQREAEVLASLNHPNIAAIHGLERADGQTALVMELVEGPTLADRIAQGPISPDEALPIAKQIAEALEAAHEIGIVHRDLKPANIKVRPDGTVKVLDFGLAKALEPGSTATSPAAITNSPTLTSPLNMTGVGVLLGTAAYMAPEQARGRAVDRRSDIWAFGCVLFEMLTGRRAFDGDDVADVLASIVKSDPEWTLLPAGMPANVQFLLERCLDKDRKQRLQDIGDVRVLLKSPLAAPIAVAAGRVRSRTWPIAIGAAILASAIAGGAVWMRRGAEAKPISKFAIDVPEGQFNPGLDRHFVALSPNGRHLVYGVGQRLYLRSMDQIEATPIRGTEGGSGEPFFSPDSQWVGFWQGGSLRKVAVTGGAPVPLCEATVPSGATWGPDDTIVFGQGTRGIWQVGGNGGPATPLLPFDEQDALTAHGPQLLPGTRSVLFTQKKVGTTDWSDASIVVHDLETGTRRVVVEGGTDARYLSTGHLVYYRDGAILAVVFDLRRLAANGGPVSAIEGVNGVGQTLGIGGNTAGAAQFALSDTGLLAYVTGSAASETDGSGIGRTLVWVDRVSRKEEPVAGARLARTSTLASHPTLPDRASRSTSGISNRTSGPSISRGRTWRRSQGIPPLTSPRSGPRTASGSSSRRAAPAHRISTGRTPMAAARPNRFSVRK
jgi:serine/threonine-protein kinase